MLVGVGYLGNPFFDSSRTALDAGTGKSSITRQRSSLSELRSILAVYTTKVGS